MIKHVFFLYIDVVLSPSILLHPGIHCGFMQRLLLKITFPPLLLSDPLRLLVVGGGVLALSAFGVAGLGDRAAFFCLGDGETCLAGVFTGVFAEST